MELGGIGGVRDPSGGFRRQSNLKKILGSKERLYCLKIDLNVTKIITVQNYKHKKKLM